MKAFYERDGWLEKTLELSYKDTADPHALDKYCAKRGLSWSSDGHGNSSYRSIVSF